MELNNESIAALTQGFTAIFNTAFENAAAQKDQVAMTIMSTTKENNYGWMGESTGFREWLGDRVIQNLSSHNYTITNKSYENTIGVSRDNIEDDNIGVYSPLFQMMAHSSAMHPDELVFQLLKDGFTKTCYDGQYFFDTDHPVLVDGVEQSVSNMQAGASTPWFLLDTTKPIKPLIYQLRRAYEFVAKDDPKDDNVFNKKQFLYGVDGRGAAGYGLWQMAFGSKATLNNTNFQLARSAMMSLKKDNGQPLNVTPNLLVVPPSLEAAADEVVKAERRANGATNTDRNKAEVLVVPLLA